MKNIRLSLTAKSAALTLALAAAAGIDMQAQTLVQSGVEISPEVYSFGDVDGSMTVLHGQFVLHNRGKDEMRLTEVVPACHCTKVEWSREAVAPGDSSVIAFDYHIDIYEKSFNKDIRVLTSRSDEPMTLRVSGRIVESDASLAQKYPYLHGALGMEDKEVNLRKVYKGETGVEIVKMVNRSGKSVKAGVGECSEGVSAEMVKKEIAPGGEGFLRVKVSSEGKWGWNEYSVTPVVDGESVEPVKVRAMIVPDYRKADDKMQREGPYPLLSSSTLRISAVSGQKSASAKLSLENVSNAQMEIFAAQVPDSRFKVTFPGRVAANATALLSVSLDASGLEPGKYSAKLYIITNSPAAPVSEVSIVYDVR